MSRKVTFKLSGEALELALLLTKDLNRDLNSLAKQCLIYCMQKAYIEAERAVGEAMHEHINKPD